VVRYLRFVTLLSCFLVVGLATLTVKPASAAPVDPQSAGGTAFLCWTYSGCANQGMGNAGYASANNKMYWLMYSGHNCTNYAAYRMVHAGMPNKRPWIGDGNATNWGVANARITDGQPSVGAVAWWRAYHPPAGSAGHVAYVERVVDANTIIVSQDSWGGEFSWKRITRFGGQWPSGFVHFLNNQLRNTVQPTISGTPKVGSSLTATPGGWSMSGVTLRYEWRTDGVAIPGGNAQTLQLTPSLVGKRITIRVFASKAGQPTVSRASHSVGPVAPGTITNTTPPAIVGQPQVGETLTADPGDWSPAGSTMTYSWRADGQILPGEDGPTLQVGPELLGKVIGLRVMTEETGYRKTGMLATRTPPVTEGTMSLTDPPTITGQTRPGQTLTLGPVVTDPKDATKSVQWLRDGVAVAGATGSTYTLGVADLGHRLAAQVTATRTGYRKLVTKAPATPLVRSLPGLKTTTQVSKGTLKLTVAVAAPGVKVVDGVIGVRLGGKYVTSFPVTNGVGTTTLKVASGTQAVQVHFRRTDLVEGRDAFRTVQVP
jgi:surface antigen